MWKQDKRIYIGLYGGLLSLILAIISCIVIGNEFYYVSIFLFCAMVFFIGFL
ncbi:MAG: hypothetical protein HEEMFOPI_02037 [Holosporales bacterium]